MHLSSQPNAQPQRPVLGLPWVSEIKLIDFLKADPVSHSQVTDSAEGIYHTLTAWQLRYDRTKADPILADLILLFEELAFSPQVDEAPLPQVVIHFNDVLRQLYDWADKRRVWVA